MKLISVLTVLVSALEIFDGGIMREIVSILIFSATLFIGVFSFPVNNPTIYEKLYPSLTPSEINLLLGRKVINNPGNKSFSGLMYPLGMKYTLDAEGDVKAECRRNGETGEIVSLQEFMKVKDPIWQKLLEECGVLVKWYEKNEDGRDMFSCHGRFSSRVFLEFE